MSGAGDRVRRDLYKLEDILQAVKTEIVVWCGGLLLF